LDNSTIKNILINEVNDMNDYYNEYKIDLNNISKNVNLKIDNFGNKSIINVLNYQYKGIENNYNNCFLNSLLQYCFILMNSGIVF